MKIVVFPLLTSSPELQVLKPESEIIIIIMSLLASHQQRDDKKLGKTKKRCQAGRKPGISQLMIDAKTTKPPGTPMSENLAGNQSQNADKHPGGKKKK